MDGHALGDDGALADGAAGSAQGVAEDGQEDDGRDDGLETEEVLDLCVGDAEEWDLKEEVEEKGDEAFGVEALAGIDVVGDVLVAGPYGCEEDFHTLASSYGLDTARLCQYLRRRRTCEVLQTYPSQMIASAHRDTTTK